jgi:hypothetical protein
MTFRKFVEYLEDRLGYHQIPRNPYAETPHDIFESCPLHDELTKQLIRTIYKRNKCQRLIDPVNREATESVLKEIRNGQFKEAKMDVDRFHFIEDFCAAVDEFFSEDSRVTTQKTSNGSENQSAQVVDMHRFRRRHVRWRA